MNSYSYDKSITDRITAIEDRLAIYNLIASHPPIIDSLDMVRMKEMFSCEGILDRGYDFEKSKIHDTPDTPDERLVSAINDSSLLHLNTQPFFVSLKDNSAIVISYVAAVVSEPFSPPFLVPMHGESCGYRLFRITSNRWDLSKENGKWKILKRTLLSLGKGGDGRSLLSETLKMSDNSI